MQLNTLAITNFKNIPDARLEFSGKMNCLLGDNGMGKSNLLDAIYCLSFCKSFSGQTDMQLIRPGETFATLRGSYMRKNAPEELTMGLQQGRRKSFKRMGKEYDRLSSHIGAFPLVLAAPADSELITGTGEERRKLMDQVISQTDPVYLDSLIRYARALQQRNRLLREHCVDHSLYAAVEMAMEGPAAYITRRREGWVEKLTEIFTGHYESIATGNERPAVGLRSHLAERRDVTMQQLLDEARRHDEAVGHTSVGPHRDDLILQLDGMEVRRTASQGQQKTYVIALRLAQYEFLARATGMKPLLLLDDIFDKLDARRVERLVEVVASDLFGQIFITDTNRSHLDRIMARSGGDHRSWIVENGRFSEHDRATPSLPF